MDSKDCLASTVRRTRRQVISGAAIALGGLVTSSLISARPQQKMEQEQGSGLEGLLTYLHQKVELPAAPARVYDALLDAKQFAAFTGMPAEISREAGGAFKTFGGLIEGRTVELVSNQRIVQAWRPSHWEPGVYSIVRMELSEHASKTTLVLDHRGFPEGQFRHLNEGWYGHYWEPLKKFLAS